MQIPVLLEVVGNNGFRASAGEPLPLSAEGGTREEALAKLRELLEGQFRKGKQLVAIEIPAIDNPWLAMVGIHDPGDPYIHEWKQAMAEYRKEKENDPDYP